MFFNKLKLWILAICLFSVNLPTCSANMQQSLDSVTSYGQSRVAFLDVVMKQLPKLSNDLKDNPALENEVKKSFINVYGKYLKISDLMTLMALQNSSTSERLVPFVIYIIIECLVVSSISHLEDKRISSTLFSSSKAKEVNNKIDFYISEIEKVANQLKTKLNSILNVSKSNAANSSSVQKLSTTFGFDEIIKAMKLKTEVFKKRLGIAIHSFCECFLTEQDIDVLVKLGPAFNKIKNKTSEKDLSIFISNLLPALPGSTNELTTNVQAILVVG